MRLKIVKAGINGEGIGFYHKKPVIIEGCFPGETIECQLKDAGRHYEGKLLKVIEKSRYRIKEACPHFWRCGACSLMALRYEEQLRIKKQLLEGALLKYAGYDRQIGDIVPAKEIFHYRNKCNLPIVDYNGTLVNALYKQGSNHPVFIDECLIHEEGVEKIRQKMMKIFNSFHLKAYDRHEKKGLRQLIIRGFDRSYQAVIVTGNDELDPKLIERMKQIEGLVSFFQGINTQRDPIRLMPDHLKGLFGREKIEMKTGDYRLRLSPQAFFQLNHDQAERIYSDVSKLIEGRKDLIIEAYCGIGAISLYLHDKAEELIGIEVIDKAIRDATENAKLNHFDNMKFICGDASAEVRKILKNRKADVLVVDPPRTGLDDELITTILKSKIPQLVYISCNPATLAKDLSLLQKDYRIVHLQGYDMFPNTPHVETVTLLSRRKDEPRVQVTMTCKSD